jgi:predicted Zn-dependent protease
VPENPEHMANWGPQKYSKANNYASSTAKTKPDFRAQAADGSITPSKKNKLVSSGFLNDTVSFSAIMNNTGLFAYNVSTNVDFSVTIKTEDGKGSGWVSRDYTDIDKLDTAKVSRVAIDKAIESATAKAMEPGKYTVILEPHASVQLLGNMINNMDHRTADEGRSFLSRQVKEGDKNQAKNKLGEKMFDSRVNIYSDPMHPEVPTAPFAADGHAVGRIDWVKSGKVTAMYNTRYWAGHTKTPYVPTAVNSGQWIMEGGDESLEEMIKNTRKGILITRLWYIRQLDPQTLMYTGLTRDGTFYVENGKIKHPIKNLRFNDSPIVMLNNIEAIGKPVRANGCMVPPLKIRDFTFSSTSDAV